MNLDQDYDKTETDLSYANAIRILSQTRPVNVPTIDARGMQILSSTQPLNIQTQPLPFMDGAKTFGILTGVALTFSIVCECVDKII